MEGLNTSGSRFVASKLYEVRVQYRVNSTFSFVIQMHFLNLFMLVVLLCVLQGVPLPFYSSPEPKQEMNEGKKSAV